MEGFNCQNYDIGATKCLVDSRTLCLDISKESLVVNLRV